MSRCHHNDQDFDAEFGYVHWFISIPILMRRYACLENLIKNISALCYLLFYFSVNTASAYVFDNINKCLSGCTPPLFFAECAASSSFAVFCFFIIESHLRTKT